MDGSTLKRFETMFDQYDTDNDGFLTGGECFPVFSMSTLDKTVLKSLWTLSDVDGDGKMTRKEFAVAMSMIMAVRGGATVPTELPEVMKSYLGVSTNGSAPSVSSGSGSTGSNGSNISSFPAINLDHMPRFEAMFASLDTDNDGKISGSEAVPFFTKSGLDRGILRTVWSMCDVDADGKMDKKEFAAAMHIIGVIRNGGSAPESLPAHLHEFIRPGATNGSAAAPAAPLSSSILASVRAPSPGPAASSPTAAGGAISVSAEELARHESTFLGVDTDGDGYISGHEAVAVFTKSGLERGILRDVWTLCDVDADGRMNKKEFAAAMGVLVAVKKGAALPKTLPDSLLQYVNAGAASAAAPAVAAAVEPVSAPPAIPAPILTSVTPMRAPTPPPNASMSATAASPMAGRPVTLGILSPDEITRFETMFTSFDSDHDGFINGGEAVAVFTKSGLDRGILRTVWSMCDVDADGKMDKKEFTIAMHILSAVKKGAAVPTSLPSGLFEYAKGAAAAPAVPAMDAPPAIPTSSILASVAGTPVRSPTPTSATSPSSGKPATIGIITPDEEARFEGFFNSVDTDKDGFATGGEAQPVMAKSGLDRSVLREVWSMCDSDADGKVNKKEFIVAMHIIAAVRKGASCPTSMPQTLKDFIGVSAAPAVPAAAIPAPPAVAAPPAPVMTISSPTSSVDALASLPSPKSLASERSPSPVAAPVRSPSPAPMLPVAAPSLPPPTVTVSSPVTTPTAAAATVNVDAGELRQAASSLADAARQGAGAAVAASQLSANLASTIEKIAAALRRERDDVLSSLNGLEQETSSITPRSMAAFQEIAALRNELSGLRVRERELLEAKTQALSSTAGSDKEREMLVEQISDVRGQLAALEDERRTGYTNVNDASSAAAVAESEARALGSLASTARHAAEQAHKDLELLRQILGSLKTQVSSASDDVSGLHSQLSAAQERAARATEESHRRRQELEASNAEREALLREKEELMQQLASSKSASPSGRASSPVPQVAVVYHHSSPSRARSPTPPPVAPSSVADEFDEDADFGNDVPSMPPTPPVAPESFNDFADDKVVEDEFGANDDEFGSDNAFAAPPVPPPSGPAPGFGDDAFDSFGTDDAGFGGFDGDDAF